MDFIQEYLFTFDAYGFLHICMMSITLLAIFLIYRYQDKIRAWKYHDKHMRYFIAITMLTMTFIYYFDIILRGEWNIVTGLPLHFCYVSGYLFIFMLLTNKKNMFRYIYFFAFAGPLPAMLLPDLAGGIQTLVMWQYFVTHQFFFVAIFYVLVVLRYPVAIKDSIIALVIGQLYFIIIIMLNSVLGSNYIMTNGLPKTVLELLPFTSYGPPVLWLEIAAMLSFMVACFPIKSIQERKMSKQF